MNKKLIFIDIDGTLTVPGSNIPPESALSAIRQAREAGHKVFLCTGRNLAMLSPVLAYGFDGAVASGGGYVLSGDSVLFDCPMTADQQEDALRLFAENGIFRTIEAKDASYCDDGMGEFMARISGGNSELLRWRKALEQDLGIMPIRYYDGRPIYKIVFMCEKREQLNPVRERLEGEFNFLIQDVNDGSYINGELVNRRFDKGSGVRLTAEHLGFAREDCIGFGDSMNDLEMIENVGLGVCMSNGSPELMKRCGMVCPPVEEDGLARAFEQLGLTGQA
ncbi:MAG: HAD family hydrolase [Clostridia bacterium]|nr:HAD family hydrolase [Clostridia bacterium]